MLRIIRNNRFFPLFTFFRVQRYVIYLNYLLVFNFFLYFCTQK